MPKASKSLLRVGNKVFVRTVTMYFTGLITEIGPSEVSFEEAAWIPWTGRYYQFLKDGLTDEVEPIPDGKLTIGRGAIVDVVNWSLSLPHGQK